MLSEKDRREYKQGIYDLYSEVGTTKLEFHPIDPNFEPNIYGDVDDVTYLPPITGLVGVIDFKGDTQNPIDPIPLDNKVIAQIELPILTLEKANLDPFSMITGQFKFLDTTFNVIDVTPNGLFTDFYTSYNFKVEMIK